MNQPDTKPFVVARDLVFEHARNVLLPLEGCPLDTLTGRVLAEDICSDADLPQADNSAMDGYCLRSIDLRLATPDHPVSLPIAGHADAGHPLDSLPPGTIAYIATGALLPPEADAVVKLEDTRPSDDGTTVTFYGCPPAGAFIRRQGQDMKTGQRLLPTGTLISPYAAGVVAAAGRTVVQVARKPRVSLLTSGDELVMPFDKPLPWQVRNANSTILAALIRRAGGEPLDFGIVRDDTGKARDIIEQALATSDVLMTTGGISMGRKDPVIAAFRDMGLEPVVHGVAMKPGKPFFFGLHRHVPVFGLPGNQASSTVTFELFVRPFLARMLGRLDPDHPILPLPLACDQHNPSGRDHFIRARLVADQNGTWAQPLFHQDSHLLSSLTGFSLLLRHPRDVPTLLKGSIHPCLLVM